MATYSSPQPYQPVQRMIIAYILLFPLLFLGVHRGFSFLAGATNSRMGAETGRFSMPVDESETILTKVENAGSLLICLVVSLPLYRKILDTALQIPIIILLPLYAVSSAIWSQDPGGSFRYAVYLLLNTFFAIYVVERFTQDQQMGLVLWTGGWLAGLSIVIALFLPQFGVDHQVHEGAWQGIFVQKNVCAGVMNLMLPPAFLLPARSKWLRALYIFSVLLVLGMTQSVSGILTALAGMALIALLAILRKFNRRDLFVMVVYGGTVLIAGLIVAWQYGQDILVALGRDPTLTGRTDIWHAVIASAWKRPLTGYGFTAFFNGMKGEGINVVLATGWFVPTAHNGLLNLWVELGAIGVALFAIMLAKACKDAATCFVATKSAYVDWCIVTIFLTIIENLDERTIVEEQQILWVLFVIVCISLAKTAKAIRSGKMPVENMANPQLLEPSKDLQYA